MNRTKLLYLTMALALLCCVSCHHSSSSDDESSVMTNYSKSTSSSLVSGFRLQPNIKVMANLDSVFFTIDPVEGVIYNADSLPKGTRINHLGTKLTFGSMVTSATYRVVGGKTYGDTTFVYRSSTVDSIDFTGRVYLDVLSADGTNTKTYRVEVRVHTADPDSLIWPTGARRALPGLTGKATQQRTITAGLATYCLTLENDKMVLSKSLAVALDEWESKELTLPFAPDMDSFAGTSAALYLLDNDGNLYESVDEGESWTSCDVVWHSIIGGYEDRLLGIARKDGVYVHDEYPRDEDYEQYGLETGFPVDGFSQLVDFDSAWSLFPQKIMAGGTLPDGTCTANVWGYDGFVWGRINNATANDQLPALTGATLIPYYTFTTSNVNFKVTQFATWMVIGGRLADGSYNTGIYTSTDQGIKWAKQTTKLSLPPGQTMFVDAQAVIDSETLSSPRGSGAPRRIAALSESWECPAIYLFGGIGGDGKLRDNVWKGVINRFLFVPVY